MSYIASSSAVRVTPSRAHFRDRARAADGRHVVARGAAGAVERRPEPFFRGFDLEKVVEPQAELLELGGRDAGKRLARRRSAELRGQDDARPDKRRDQQA